MTKQAAEHKSHDLASKLELALHYLRILDAMPHVHGFDYTPEGWDITVRELITRLESNNKARLAAKRRVKRTR